MQHKNRFCFVWYYLINDIILFFFVNSRRMPSFENLLAQKNN
jgi:hypothetical protein